MFKSLLKVNIHQFDEAKITLNEVKKFLSDNQDNEEVKAYIKELSKPTAESVEEFLKTYEGKKVLQPYLDRHFTKGLETWKQNNLEKLIDEEIKKRNPDKTPEQIEIEKLKKQIEDAEKARSREALVNKALKVAKDKNLPDGIIDFFIADDEENTLSNLSKLEEEFSKAVQSAVDAKFKANGRNIDRGGDRQGNGNIDIGSIANEVSLRK